MMIIGDSVKELFKMKDEVQTWIVDPPYNIGFDYENFTDKIENYPEWIGILAEGMFNRTKENGSFFLIHYPIDCARLLPEIESKGWKLHQWISWVYPSNIGMSKNKFTTAHRTILWFSKSKKPKFSHVVGGEYKNPNDKRIKERIAQGKSPPLYDWWNINLCKNVSKDFKGYANQIPEKLLERLILNTTDEEDLVGDCCAGSGSTLRTALKHNRKIWGCDINSSASDLWSDLL